MQLTSAAVLIATALAGAAGGAALHAVLTTRVAVTCPPAQADDGDLKRFLATPAPPSSGNPRY